ELVVVPTATEGGAEVAGSDVGGDDTGRGPFHEQHVVGTRRLVHRPGKIHDTALDRELAAEGLEAGIAQIGVFDSGHGAARKKADGCTAGTGRSAKAVRGTAE